MSSKISVGLAKKVGLPNYGSLAASCHVEVPAADDPLASQDDFERRVRRAFAACLKAVEEQLTRQQGSALNGRLTGSNQEPAAPTRENVAREGSVPRATPSQVRAIRGLAASRRLDLAAFLRERHGITSPDDLTVRWASAVIDHLKERVAAGSRR